MNQILSDKLSHTLTPLCPRDNHVMHYEPQGIHWRAASRETEVAPSYHCGYIGCSVRYTHEQGYFTVVKTPEEPYFAEEPATNVLRCPRHNAWLYRCHDKKEDHFIWRCGVEGCDYTHTDVPGVWLRE